MPALDAAAEKPSEKRYLFAEHLRALAALSVVAAHYFGVFWSSNEGVLALAGLPPLENGPSLTSGLPGFVIPWQLVLGQFGVGVFFCISGFVICMALERESWSAFLLRRLFRIFPAYAAGFLAMMAVCMAVAKHAGRIFPYTPTHIAAHLFPGFLGFTGFERIDGISWTLEVEVWFYAAVAALSPWLLIRHRAIAALVPAVATMAAILLMFSPVKPLVSIQVSCATLLAMGYVSYLYVRNAIDGRQYRLWSAYFASLLTGYWIAAHQFMNVPYDWLWGFLLGAACWQTALSCRAHFRQSRLIGHFAAISYPLYVVHALSGYSIMFLVYPATHSVLLSAMAAFAIVYLLSVALHVTVEKPCIELGRRISKRLTHFTNPATG